MPIINISRSRETGLLAGVDEKHDRGYQRFIKRMRELAYDAVLVLKWYEPRSPKFHRYHFAILGVLFKQQDQFSDAEDMRKWLEVGAGHCKFVPGPHGKMVALPLSINYEALDDVEFEEHHRKVKEFVQSEHATNFLWPHLSKNQSYEMLRSIIDSFELLN